MKTIPITTSQTVLVSFQDDNEVRFEIRNQAALTVIIIEHKPIEAVLEIDLLESGTSAVINGVVVGDGDNHINLKTYQNHKAPHTTSDLLIKSVMRDTSTFAYNGIIRVEEGAQQTNAYQRNDSLMLSSDAHATTSPALEILADDVRCTHGATIGSIDEGQLFYLASRGVSLEESQHLITQGFLLSVTDRILDEALKEKVQQEIKGFL